MRAYRGTLRVTTTSGCSTNSAESPPAEYVAAFRALHPRRKRLPTAYPRGTREVQVEQGREVRGPPIRCTTRLIDHGRSRWASGVAAWALGAGRREKEPQQDYGPMPIQMPVHARAYLRHGKWTAAGAAGVVPLTTGDFEGSNRLSSSPP